MNCKRMVVGMIFLVIQLTAAMGGMTLVGQVNTHPGPLKTFEEALEERGIGLDRDSLLAALNSDQSEVQKLAAFKLAADGVEDAIPILRDLLRTLEDSALRAAMASALAQLGVSEGIDALKELCEPPNPPQVRLTAIRYLRSNFRLPCADDLIEILSTGEHDLHVLGTLRGYRGAFEGERREEVISMISARLLDPDRSIRMAAASALAGVAGEDARPHLEALLMRETDSSVLKHTRRVLSKLDEEDVH